MKKPLHPVSDHAVIRYLEHVEGRDIEALRREIGRKVDMAVSLGASAVVIGKFQYRIVDGVVVTVVQKSGADIRTGRCGRRRERGDG